MMTVNGCLLLMIKRLVTDVRYIDELSDRRLKKIVSKSESNSPFNQSPPQKLDCIVSDEDEYVDEYWTTVTVPMLQVVPILLLHSSYADISRRTKM